MGIEVIMLCGNEICMPWFDKWEVKVKYKFSLYASVECWIWFKSRQSTKVIPLQWRYSQWAPLLSQCKYSLSNYYFWASYVITCIVQLQNRGLLLVVTLFFLPLSTRCHFGMFAENASLGPPTSALANSKRVAPVTVFSNAMLQVYESDSTNCQWHGVCRNHMLKLLWGRI